MAVALQRRLLTVSDYHRMVAAGILSESDHVELLHGEIIEMAAVNTIHTSCVNHILRRCSKLIEDQYLITVQNPITLGTHSEPEPDLCICHFKSDYYKTQHPTGKDILLVIEVAASSLEKDRHVKAPLYAAADIPEYWIFNLQDGWVEVFRKPLDGRYTEEVIYKDTDQLAVPGALDGELRLANFF